MHTYSRQAAVYVPVPAAEQVSVCGAQVPVEEGVNKGVH